MTLLASINWLALPSWFRCVWFRLASDLILPFPLCRPLRSSVLPNIRLVGLSLAGVFAALDIMLSNLSLVTLSASFYTFLKSSSLIFVLIVGVLTFVEELSLGIVTTVSLVSVGMFLMSYGEANFDVAGAILVLTSELFAALRWI